MEEPLKSNAIRYGTYLGSVLSIMLLLAYFIDLNFFVNFWYGISIYFIAIGFGIGCVIKTKIDLNGFLSFKNSFSVYFLTVLTGLLISTLLSYVLFNFLDLNSADALKEKSIEKMVEMLQSINKTDQEITSAIGKAKTENLYSVSNVFQGLIFNYLLPLSIIGLLVAATTQKNKVDTK